MSPIYLPLYADAEYTNPEETPNHLFEQPIEINGKYNFIEYNPGHPEEGIIPQYLDNQEEEEFDLNVDVPVGEVINNKVVSIKMNYNTIADNSTQTDWTFYSSMYTLNLPPDTTLEILTITRLVQGPYIWWVIDYYVNYDGTNGITMTINSNTWVYIKNKSTSGYSPLEFYCDGGYPIFTTYDRVINDKAPTELRLWGDLLKFDGINWMTFD